MAKTKTNEPTVSSEISIITDSSPKYNLWTGIWKTVKNSAFLLIPFLLAILAGVPAEYAWATGPVIYFLKNLYENKLSKR